MNLIDELNDLNTKEIPRAYGPGVRCGVDKLRDSTDDDTWAAMSQVIDNANVPATLVADLLNKHGLSVSASTVARHRKRGTGAGCKCAR